MEQGPKSQEIRWPLEGEEGKETDSPLRVSKRKHPDQHLDFSFRKVISDLHKYKGINLCCFMLQSL